ncbi:MAG: hypothetical protein ACLU0O_05400 [Collinsella sp.]
MCRWQCRPRRHRASRAFAPAAHRLPVPRCPQPLRRRRQRYRPRASLRLARHPRSRGRGPYGRVTRSHRCRYRHDGWRLRPRPASRGTRAARPKDKVASYVEDGGSLLAICGSYQLLGRSYYMGEDRIEGLGSLLPKPYAAPTA